MPHTSLELRSQLGLDRRNGYGYIPDVITNILPIGHKIGKPSPLFKKIEDGDVEMLRKKYSGKQETENKTKANNVHDAEKSLESAIATQVINLFNNNNNNRKYRYSILVLYLFFVFLGRQS